MQETVSRVIRAAREKKMPIILDADALLVVQKDPGLVKGYKETILTPNVVEFGRLWDALKLDDPGNDSETGKVETLAKALGGVTIIQKGGKDFISNGRTTLTDDLEGGKKRSGGQGDTLTGTVATFLGWRRAYLDRLWDVGDNPLSEDEMMGLAAFGGSAITRVSDVPRLCICSRDCRHKINRGIGVVPAGFPQAGSEPAGERPDGRGAQRFHGPFWGGRRRRRCFQAVVYTCLYSERERWFRRRQNTK